MSDICYICLTNNAIIKTKECNHYLLCISCYLQYNTQLTVFCPICRYDNINLILYHCYDCSCIDKWGIITDFTKIVCYRLVYLLKENSNLYYDCMKQNLIIRNNIKFIDDNIIIKMCLFLEKLSTFEEKYNIFFTILADSDFNSKTMLTYVQTMKIGKLLLVNNTIDLYQFKPNPYKTLVKYCFEPWKLDKKIFMDGVCYHGNFGDIPIYYKDAFFCINTNHLNL